MPTLRTYVPAAAWRVNRTGAPGPVASRIVSARAWLSNAPLSASRTVNQTGVLAPIGSRLAPVREW